MRQRAIAMTSLAVGIAVLFLGIPGLFYGAVAVWRDTESELDTRAETVMFVIERLESAGQRVQEPLLETMAASASLPDVYISATYPDGEIVESGEPPSGRIFDEGTVTAAGVVISVQAPQSVTWARIALLMLGEIVLIGAAFAIGRFVARRKATELSEPLVLLAASAEQIGAGQVRPNLDPTGIKEIDLVYQELERTASRMAGRIAAERQFAADAAHQLRTPLTALSMRLEEILYLSDDPDVIEEANKGLEQIDRLSGVVDELMATSRSASGGRTEAVSLTDTFAQQREEWTPVFRAASRELVFDTPQTGAVLSTPGSLSQILATLIENSLKYGDGTTTISSAKAGKMVSIKVRDEGAGIPEDVADSVFKKGVSTGGSTGIGLAVAKELAVNDGGRLELTCTAPAEFTLTLAAVPQTFDPDRVVPHGAIISLGARRRRR
ncbi:MAG: HAMP domain-containing histidine kinase [Actinomycetaceae bacterium]|nr:HAMP domain-containing histidine kinase [Actinomycetaceae bacterium]